MRVSPREVAGWLLLLSASLALSLAAWRLPPRPDPPAPPPPLPRPPTPTEAQAVLALQQDMQGDLDRARQALTRPPRLDELEGPLPDGGRVLRGGLPDNPLRPGVAAVVPRCPPTPAPDDGADWLYCEESGTIAAVGLEVAPAR